MKIAITCLNLLMAISAALPAVESDATKERELILDRVQNGKAALAGSIDLLAELEGEQLMSALPEVLQMLEAGKHEKYAVTSLLIGLRKSQQIIPEEQLRKLQALAADGNENYFLLLHSDQQALLTLARERAATKDK